MDIKNITKEEAVNGIKSLFIDVMLKGRFVATLRYRYCPAFPLDIEELSEFVVSKLPTLRNKPFNIVF